MSWLLGRRGPSGDAVPHDPTGGAGGDNSSVGASADGSKDDGYQKAKGAGDGTSSSSYRFDSAALERAAKAARELEGSRMLLIIRREMR